MQKFMRRPISHAPDWSGSPEAAKAIFSRFGKAPGGSSCRTDRKKALAMRAIAESWNRHINKEKLPSGNSILIRPRHKSRYGFAIVYLEMESEETSAENLKHK